MQLLVTGASGSGTTTLGKAIARAWGAQFLDADDYFWLKTDPPYKERQTHEVRLSSLLTDLIQCEKSVVSGSVMNWGAALEHSFELVVFLQVPTVVRLDRIRRREVARFGQVNPEFLEWASQYDDGPPEGRSLAKHNTWLAALSCPVIRLVGDLSQNAQIVSIVKALPNTSVERDSLQAALADSLRASHSGCSSLPP